MTTGLQDLRQIKRERNGVMKMKIILGWIVWLNFCQPGLAATNDLTATLQKGLFEEEANHDLPAAMRAYEEVVRRFDEQRKLGATAIFRLGEIYRKQGKTN